MVDVYIQSEIGICQEYMAAKGKKESVSIVISPLQLKGIEEKNLKVISGCNMWLTCENHRCFYSKAARGAPKIKAQTN